MRCRKLRRFAEATMLGVKSLFQLVEALLQDLRRQRSHRQLTGLRRLNIADQFFTISQQFLAFAPPFFLHRFENLQQARPSPFAGFRQISRGIKRFAVWRQDDGHRPAAAAGSGLAGCHIYIVDIRPFFAVDFDADKTGIQRCRDCFVFKTFMRHHMAPVTSAVADAQKYRFILGLGFCERRLSPGIPIHRIVDMLQQIR